MTLWNLDTLIQLASEANHEKTKVHSRSLFNDSCFNHSAFVFIEQLFIKGNMTNIGKLIRSNRKARGISQVRLAKHLGCSSQFVANWERAVSNPPLNYIRRICEFVGIGITESKEALELDYKEKLKEI